MWLRNSTPSLWHRSKKVRAEAILCILRAPMSIFGTHLAQNLWQPSLACDNLQKTVYEICGNSQESSEIHKFFGQHFEQDNHSLQMADHFTLHREHLFTHLWKFYSIVLEFLHSLYFGLKLRKIHDGFPQRSSL
jgi:hypothetical protein